MKWMLNEDDVNGGCELVSAIIDTQVDETNKDIISEHLNDLISIQGNAATVQASAKFWLQKGKTPERVATYELAERLSKGLSNKISALQTILRKEIQSEFNSRNVK